MTKTLGAFSVFIGTPSWILLTHDYWAGITSYVSLAFIGATLFVFLEGLRMMWGE